MRPYSEVLMDQVEAQLKWITVARGFSINMQSVQRYDIEDLNTATKPCCHLHIEEETKSRSGSEWEVILQIGIWVFVDQLSTDTRKTEEMEMEVGADIERAIGMMEDDPDFIATLEEVKTIPLSMHVEEGVEHGVEVKVTLGYRVDFADPRVPTVSNRE